MAKKNWDKIITRYNKGWTYKEIAEDIGSTVRAVTKDTFRMRKEGIIQPRERTCGRANCSPGPRLVKNEPLNGCGDFDLINSVAETIVKKAASMGKKVLFKIENVEITVGIE